MVGAEGLFDAWFVGGGVACWVSIGDRVGAVVGVLLDVWVGALVAMAIGEFVGDGVAIGGVGAMGAGVTIGDGVTIEPGDLVGIGVCSESAGACAGAVVVIADGD